MLSRLRRFCADRSGNFAILAAVAALPLTVGVGAALDVSAIQRSRSSLQQAADAAAIALAREGVTVSDEKAYAIAQTLVAGNFGSGYSDVAVQRNGTNFTVKASGVADTTFGGLLGYNEWKVNAISSADIALVPYEIALVLDTTGSMLGGKLQSMKDAVIGLVDTMSENVTVKDNLKFAMVPFSSFVNVGPQFAPKFNEKGKLIKGSGAPWLDLKGKNEMPQMELTRNVSRFELFRNLGTEWAGCVETREPTKKVAYDVADRADGKDESLFVPAFSIDEPDTPAYQNSYIVSDADPTDKSVIGKLKKLQKYGISALPVLDSDELALQPVTSSITPSKGPNANCVTQPILPLSNDYQSIRDKVISLKAKGNTNIMEGVAWGWRVLSPGEPFTEGAPKKAKSRKIMIVLTDGSNVFGIDGNAGNALGSTYSSFGFAIDQRLLPLTAASTSGTNTAMNAKTIQACANAKADGVEIFTIRLEEPDKDTGMMLKDCASAPDHFFDAPSRKQLDEVFGQIRDKITSVRLSS